MLQFRGQDADRCFAQSEEAGDTNVYRTVVIFIERCYVTQISAVAAVNGAADPAGVRDCLLYTSPSPRDRS